MRPLTRPGAYTGMPVASARNQLPERTSSSIRPTIGSSRSARSIAQSHRVCRDRGTPSRSKPLLLAVQRKVVEVFVEHHLGEEPVAAHRLGQGIRDRRSRRDDRGFRFASVIRERHLFLNRLDPEDLGGLALESPADVLTDGHRSRAAPTRALAILHAFVVHDGTQMVHRFDVAAPTPPVLLPPADDDFLLLGVVFVFIGRLWRVRRINRERQLIRVHDHPLRRWTGEHPLQRCKILLESLRGLFCRFRACPQRSVLGERRCQSIPLVFELLPQPSILLDEIYAPL